MPKHVAGLAITAVAGSGAGGVGARGVLESVGGRAIPISTAPGAVGCTFEPGALATGSFVAFGGVGNQGPTRNGYSVWEPMRLGRSGRAVILVRECDFHHSENRIAAQNSVVRFVWSAPP